MKKKIATFALAACMLAAPIAATNAYAVTPSIDLGAIGQLGSLNQRVDDAVKNAEQEAKAFTSAKPKVTKCSLVEVTHYGYAKFIKWYTTNVVAEWSAVSGATSYEVEICNPDGTVQDTQSVSEAKISVPVKAGTEEVKIRVRGVNSAGAYTQWSDYYSS